MTKRRITVSLDVHLLTAVDAVAAERKKSRNQFIVEAIRKALKMIERERVDAAFARMADDAEYQALLLEMERELAPAHDEVWRRMDEAERRDRASG